jgi:hypothetical protein
MLRMAAALVERHEDFNRLPDQFVASVSEHALDFRVDEDDGAVAVDHDLAARRGIDRHSELVFREPPLCDLPAQLGRLGVDIGCHAGEGARQDADLAAGIGRDRHRLVAPECRDGCGHLGERPRQRARQHDGQKQRHQGGGATPDQGEVTDRRYRRHGDFVRHGLDNGQRGTAREPHAANADAEPHAGAILYHARLYVGCRQDARELRKVVLNALWRAECKTELLCTIGIDEVITPVIHQIDVSAGKRG